MIRRILTWPDPVLACPAAPVAAFDAELRTLAADMLETMYAAPGRGLAAPQVGVLLRLFVMDATWKEGERNPLVVVNPVLSELSTEPSTFDEGCLSIPGLMASVTRPAEATLDWMDLDGVRHRRRLAGFEALCVQHETDHLDGILTLDRIDAAQLAALEPGLARLRAA